MGHVFLQTILLKCLVYFSLGFCYVFGWWVWGFFSFVWMVGFWCWAEPMTQCMLGKGSNKDLLTA